MNAAFLLMTSACLAGANYQPPATAAPAAAPPAAAAPAAAPAPCGGCGPTCAAACDPCQKASLLDKIRARLQSRKKSGCCDSAPTCCPAPAPAPTCCAPAPTCNTCRPACGTPLFKGIQWGHKKDSCNTCSTGCSGAGSCDPCPRVSFLDKIKAKLACSKNSSCDSGCGGGCSAPGCAPAASAPAAGGAAPAPMPMGEKKQS